MPRLKIAMCKAPVFLLMVFLAGSVSAQEPLESVLEPYLAKYELPAVAACVVKKGEIVAVGAVGTRRAGQEIKVTRDDRFHLGSDTKAMTSLIAGTFVDEGKLGWKTTIGQVFPELVEGMDPEFRDVTLEQLLSHTSGLASDDEAFFKAITRAMEGDGNLNEIRYNLLKTWRSEKLAKKAGSGFAYSNKGYMIAGIMIERVGGKSWDELIVDRVFLPLNLKTAGLGPQSSLGRVDAPLGHIKTDKGFQAFLAGPNGDNPIVVGPAGIAHMSVLDFARWASWHAGLGKRGPRLVSAETLAKLHKPMITFPTRPDAPPGTPKSGQYALGWGVVSPEWASLPLLFHGGSNEKNLAHIWVDTEHDQAIVLVTNISNPKSDEGFRALIKELAAKYGFGH